MHSCPTARRKTKINLLTLLSLRSCGVPPPFRPTASTHLNTDRLSADYDTTSTAWFHAFTALHLGVTSAQALALPQRKRKIVIAHHAERQRDDQGHVFDRSTSCSAAPPNPTTICAKPSAALLHESSASKSDTVPRPALTEQLQQAHHSTET